jgi:hypothetical protein
MRPDLVIEAVATFRVRAVQIRVAHQLAELGRYGCGTAKL